MATTALTEALSPAAFAPVFASLDPPQVYVAIAETALRVGADCSVVYELGSANSAVRMVLRAASDAILTRAGALAPRLDAASTQALRAALDAAPAQWFADTHAPQPDPARGVWDAALWQALPPGAALLLPMHTGQSAVHALGFHVLAAERLTQAMQDQAKSLAQCGAVALRNAFACQAALRAVSHRDQLLSVLAHGVGSPLTAIRLAAWMLGRQPRGEPLPDEAWEYVGHVGQAVTEVERLIEWVRDLRRIAQQRLEVRMAACEAAPLLAEAWRLNATAAEARSVALSVTSDATLPLVQVDRQRTIQLLSILLARAIAVTRPFGQVQLTAALEGDQVVVSVRDAGAPPDTRGHALFDYFWEMPADAGDPETFLQLAIARGIAELQRSCLEAEPSPDGTTIRLRLAAAPA